MNSKRQNGKRNRISEHKLRKLQTKAKVTAEYNNGKVKNSTSYPLPKEVIIAIQTDLESGEGLLTGLN